MDFLTASNRKGLGDKVKLFDDGTLNAENKNIRTSSFYNSEPLYNQNQPPFINIVVELHTTLSPFEFLDQIQDLFLSFS